MNIDATGPDEIRAALAAAVGTTAEQAEEVDAIAAVLAEAADWYESRQMTASTVAYQRAAADLLAAAAARMTGAHSDLEAALADFNARDGAVAEAVADAGNLADTAILTGGDAAAGPGRPTSSRELMTMDQPDDRCGATLFGSPHPYEPDDQQLDPDGYYEWEVCGRPAADPVHIDVDGIPEMTDVNAAEMSLYRDGDDPDDMPDVLGVAGAPRYEEIIGSDRVPGQGAVPAHVLLADWDSQPGWEPGGKYVVLETPAHEESDPSGAPMSPAEADEFADQLDDLADKAEHGVRPPQPSTYARAAQRIADDIKAGHAKPGDKLWWGDDGELPLTNAELLELLRRADPAGTADDGARTHVVCQAATDAGSDEHATWAHITPDGDIAVTAIEGTGGSSNPDDEFWAARTSIHTPDTARELADKVRGFAAAARRDETPPAPAADPGPAPAGPRRIRNGLGEDTEYDPATGISYAVQRDGWRAPLPASSPTAVSTRLLHMRETIHAGPDHAVTTDQARDLVSTLTVEELKTVCAEIGYPADHRTRTKKALIDHIVGNSVGFVLDAYAINPEGHRPTWGSL